MSVMANFPPDLSREKREEIEATYRPLPLGWLFPCGTIGVLILWGLAIASAIPMLTGGGSAIAALLLFMIIRGGRQCDYWDLNVIGYARWYYLSRGKLRTAIAKRCTNYARLDAPIGTVTITCPIGGWLHQSRVITIIDDITVENLTLLHNVTVSRPDVCGDVWLRWHGRSICVSIWNALENLQHSFGPGGSLDFAGDLVKRLRLATQQRDAARADLTRTTATMRETVTRISATSRFQHSKEAQAIRERLEHELAALNPDPTPSADPRPEPAHLNTAKGGGC